MAWRLIGYAHLTKEDLRGVLGKAKFYADHNIDKSIVHVLRQWKYDVEVAAEIGAERQPDEFHYRRASKSKRVLLTQYKDYLDNRRFPLSQSQGVILFNVDQASTRGIARALEVINKILAGVAPVLNESKVIVNSDYSIMLITRERSNGGFEETRTRYRFDENGRDIWIWEDD